jgi:RHS repeat-associated protein
VRRGYTQSYGYNPIGNIISTTMLGTYTYNPSGANSVRPHAVLAAGSNQYSYDLNGNMTQRVEVTATQRITYTQGWDVENRLIAVTRTVKNESACRNCPLYVSDYTYFLYDGDGARVAQTNITGTQAITTVYAGALEVTITGTQRITKSYYFAGSQLIALRVYTAPTSSVLYYLHGDHLGSTSLTTDASGNAVARQLYDAWGNIRYVTGTLPTDIGYTGQRLDNSTGLMYYRARYYAHYLNRWLSPDTIVPDQANPQSLNRYSYGLNNPVRYTDPTGHYVCDEDTGDCSTRRWHRFGASATLTAGQLRAIYGIRLTADKAQVWSATDIQNISDAVQQIAASMDFATWSNGKPTVAKVAGLFQKAMGSVRLNRSSDTGANGAYAYTDPAYAGQLIQVYSNAPAGKFSFQNAAHELGHAFAQHQSRRPYTALQNEEITYLDKTSGLSVHVAGGGGERTFRGMYDYPWIQDDATVASPGINPTNEDFADMFLGWAYNHFRDDQAGAARHAWMTTNVAEWIR